MKNILEKILDSWFGFVVIELMSLLILMAGISVFVNTYQLEFPWTIIGGFGLLGNIIFSWLLVYTLFNHPKMQKKEGVDGEA